MASRKLKLKPYSKKVCPKGTISRRKYSYYKKSIRKRVNVKNACVKSKGLRSKLKKPIRAIGPLKEGDLTKYNYHIHLSEPMRHKSLIQALKAYGYAPLVHKINAIRVYSKNTAPSNYKLYTKDLEYIKRKFAKKYSKSLFRRMSRKSRKSRK